MSSLICNIIKEHKEDWRDFFRENYPDIHIKEETETPYALFSYTIKANFNDPVVQEARGIIINTEIPEVACYPFRKFGKPDESYVDTIDWSSSRVEEKIDGSLIKLWFDKILCKWQFSSNKAIRLEDAFCNDDHTMTLMDVLIQASGYEKIVNEVLNTESSILNKDKTYLFELISPNNKVVINHKATTIYHIGTRNNKTGIEEMTYIGIKRPDVYNLHSFEECHEFVTRDCNRHYKNRKYDDCRMEGFVVVDKNWNRMKIKSPLYSMLHNIISSSETSKRTLIQMIWNNDIDLESIYKNYPDLAHCIKYYDWKISEFRYQATSFIDISRKIYNLFDGDRKRIANIIKNDPFSVFAFRALDNEKTLDEIVNSLNNPIKTISDFIPDYEPKRNGYLLTTAYECLAKIKNNAEETINNDRQN